MNHHPVDNGGGKMKEKHEQKIDYTSVDFKILGDILCTLREEIISQGKSLDGYVLEEYIPIIGKAIEVHETLGKKNISYLVSQGVLSESTTGGVELLSAKLSYKSLKQMHDAPGNAILARQDKCDLEQLEKICKNAASYLEQKEMGLYKPTRD